MDKSWMNKYKYILAILFSIAIAACGKTNDTALPPDAANLITGTAAAGAPVVGYVSVRDSSANAQPVKTNIPIEANGK